MTVFSIASIGSTVVFAVVIAANVAIQDANSFDPSIKSRLNSEHLSNSVPSNIRGNKKLGIDSGGKLQIAANSSGGTAPAATEKQADVENSITTLKEAVQRMDYQRALYHPLHFKPLIDKTTDAECLVCHKEILTYKPRPTSPAGASAEAVLAWYQTLDSYSGKQESFHYRHLESPFAKKVMNLSCTFCHKGNDPREESPDMTPVTKAFTAAGTPDFTLRKLVNPTKTCLLCHGAMPNPEEIMALDGPWHEIRSDFEDEETPNGCLTCHEEIFRTVRHQVNYLNATGIEEAAKNSSDVCYGCHGGRQWYRISYPYPRHPWPDMDEETPEWAKNRPIESEPEHQLTPKPAQ